MVVPMPDQYIGNAIGKSAFIFRAYTFLRLCSFLFHLVRLFFVLFFINYNTTGNCKIRYYAWLSDLVAKATHLEFPCDEAMDYRTVLDSTCFSFLFVFFFHVCGVFIVCYSLTTKYNHADSFISFCFLVCMIKLL